MHRATPAMSNDTALPFGFPAVGRKKLIAAFDGGRITTDGGVLLLGAVERQLGLATRLAQLIADPRNPALVTHSVDDILRARILAIACGYEDADDLDHLRADPAFKLACHRLPNSGGDVIDAIRRRLAQARDREVMPPDRFGAAFRAQFTPVVLEITNQFLLFGIDRDHRLPSRLKGLHRGVDVLELRIAVGMVAAFAGLAVG